MEPYIWAGIAAVIVFGPTFAWRFYIAYKTSQRAKEFISKPFVCPNCGHRFYTRQRWIRCVGKDRAILKCPSCGKRDLCTRPYDFDESA